MPPLEETGMEQDAVLWPAIGYNRDGKPKLGPPTPLKVNWSEVGRLARDPSGNQILIEAEVVVPQKIALNSVMALGTMDELGLLGTAPVPTTVELMEVAFVDSVPDPKAEAFYREVSLKRWRGSLPPSGGG